jgi:hypothetical protein
MSYSDEEEIGVRVKRYRAPSPRGVPHFIETREREIIRGRPSSYYQAGGVLLSPERGAIVTRSRSRSHERRSSTSQAGPVIIHNNIINEQSSDDDYYSDASKRSRRRRRRSRSRSRHSRGSGSSHELNWELEKARRELDELKLVQARERDGRRLEKQYRDGSEFNRVKRELDEIKQRERIEQEQQRIRKEIEYKQLEEERRAAHEKKRREKEAAHAVAKYKAEEAERHEKERKEKELAEKEYQRRLQEDLITAGVDEKDIEAIMKKKKIGEEEGVPKTGRPTYTRMSLKDLEIETLVYFKVDYEMDKVSTAALPTTRSPGLTSSLQEPGYVVIKRMVPAWEQDMFWAYSRQVRIHRKKSKHDHKVVLEIEDKKHHRRKSSNDDQFMWVAKKSERKRSKSPSLLMYLAGGRP